MMTNKLHPILRCRMDQENRVCHQISHLDTHWSLFTTRLLATIGFVVVFQVSWFDTFRSHVQKFYTWRTQVPSSSCQLF
jgi:hypothetical protein